MEKPAVYITENNSFPGSIVQVPTAMPVFIGYTEFAVSAETSVLHKPVRISSLADYHDSFGYAPKAVFTVTKETGDSFSVIRSDKYIFYNCICSFFENGGEECYILSVGNYTDEISKDTLLKSLEALQYEAAPALIVVPEAIKLELAADCYDLQKKMLEHCGAMQSRMAILDIYNGDRPIFDSTIITDFRNGIGVENLNYGSAYYPWLNTIVTKQNDLSFKNIKEGSDALKAAMITNGKNLPDKIKKHIDVIDTDLSFSEAENIHKTLLKLLPLYNDVIQKMLNEVNVLPPSSAMAGIYNRTDSEFGVWKAPANTEIREVLTLSFNINDDSQQQDLNKPQDGKSINTIRYFNGRGILVWGARTLDGNSSDWRYISVRRTILMIEQSVKSALQAFVFSPNTSVTWITIETMINNYLHSLWQQGALMGSTPTDAYVVNIGLGSTMTANDILDNYVRVMVRVAVVNPAEFISLTFQQQMLS